MNDPKGVHQLSSYGDASLSSFYSLGLFLGCLVSPLFGELMGRRNGTLVSCLIFAIGVGIMLGGSTFGVFVVGRAICGGGLGIMSCLLSLYLAESSSQRVRGAVISSYQWTIVSRDPFMIPNVNHIKYNRMPVQFWPPFLAELCLSGIIEGHI